MADNSMNFDSDGEWSDQGLVGPAIHAPSHIKAIVINKYRIEWLDMSEPGRDLYAKNHIVTTTIFAQPIWINGREWSSARLSMEIGPDDKVVADVNEVRSSRIPVPIYTDLKLIYIFPTRNWCLARSTTQGYIPLLYSDAVGVANGARERNR